jgi:hypothetical protein
MRQSSGGFAQSNQSGDVIRASGLAGVRDFPVVTLHLPKRTEIPRPDGLLRARGKRPRCKNSNPLNEIASSHYFPKPGRMKLSKVQLHQEIVIAEMAFTV